MSFVEYPKAMYKGDIYLQAENAEEEKLAREDGYESKIDEAKPKTKVKGG